MKRKTSKAGYALIEKWEQFREKAYQDSKGVWTIGYGHTRTAFPGATITRSDAIRLFKQDVEIVEHYINNHFPGLRQCQFDALVSLLFNIGADGDFLEKKTAHYLKTDPDSRFVAYNWIEFSLSGGKYYRGLLRRRIDELGVYYDW